MTDLVYPRRAPLRSAAAPLAGRTAGRGVGNPVGRSERPQTARNAATPATPHDHPGPRRGCALLYLFTLTLAETGAVPQCYDRVGFGDQRVGGFRILDGGLPLGMTTFVAPEIRGSDNSGPFK